MLVVVEKALGNGFLANDVKPDLGEIESKLSGNTLRLYWYMVKVSHPVTIHEAQKGLNLSSPGLAAYHLDKLVALRLVEKNKGEYHLLNSVRIGVLRSFVRLYGFMVPRYVFYAVFFTVLSAIFAAFFVNPFSFQSWFAVAVCLISAAIFWYEALRIWCGRPF